jgi:hypothetical protein
MISPLKRGAQNIDSCFEFPLQRAYIFVSRFELTKTIIEDLFTAY